MRQVKKDHHLNTMFNISWAFSKNIFFTPRLNVRHENLSILLEMKFLGQTNIEPIFMQIFICGFDFFKTKNRMMLVQSS
jgi:hypothetical protein